MKDYYQILGVSRDASSEDIKRAFHRLAHKYHPHKGGDEQKFKEINEAYQILSNKEKREQYDNYGRVFDGMPGSGQGFENSWFWGTRPGEGADFEFDMEDLGDIFGDFFGFGGEQRSAKKDVKKGKDIRIDIEIPLEETLKGITKKISLTKKNFCPRCQGTGAEPDTKIKECFSCRGTGQVQQIKKTFFGSFTRWSVCPECGGEGNKPEIPCNVCRGEGRIKGEDDIDIFISAGIDSNQVIKVAHKGEAGRRGGKAGDLYVRIFVKPHPTFTRKGDDLYVSLPISFAEAALGADIEAPTLDKENIILKIPAGTESGKILRVSGKGIPNFSGFGKGNLYVELTIRTPKKLTKKQKELLEKLKDEGL